jgi:type II secretory pathway pseudopilin PulG
MSALVIVLIVLAAVVLLLFVGGLVASRRRARQQAAEYAAHLAEADRALEQARAADRGWDRAVMEATVQKAVEEHSPGFAVERLDLVLVDDRPGVSEDRAHFVAAGPGGELRVVLARREAGWAAENVG